MSQYILLNNQSIMEVPDSYDLQTKFQMWEAKGLKAEKIKKPPSVKTLEKWMNDGVAKATDGCKVEPDGCCPHGKPSWLIAMHLI